MSFSSVIRDVFVIVTVLLLGGCAAIQSPPHLKPLPAELRAKLAKKGMAEGAPIFIRVFKKEAKLEVWKKKEDGRFHHLKSYPICKFSGGLGPKLKQGDKQAPEGFYRVSQGAMNPNSKYHLSFNLGYPNVYDRAHGRTGKHLMVHGGCKSAGCYAMTDALMEEIYFLARDAFIGGQDTVPVHAFPFRMTRTNLRRYRDNKWYRFWKSLKEGYDHFERHKTLPKVDVCSKRYLINASFVDRNDVVDPQLKCPRYKKFVPGAAPYSPRQIMAKAPQQKKVVPIAYSQAAIAMPSLLPSPAHAKEVQQTVQATAESAAPVVQPALAPSPLVMEPVPVAAQLPDGLAAGNQAAAANNVPQNALPVDPANRLGNQVIPTASGYSEETVNADVGTTASSEIQKSNRSAKSSFDAPDKSSLERLIQQSLQ